jgi:membrane protease YdiL (CAAX protease family)
MGAVAAPLPRAGLLTIGLGAGVALRIVLAGSDGLRSASAGLAFAAILAFLAAAAGWRPGRIRPGPIAIGLLGAAVLVVAPARVRLTGTTPAILLPSDAWPLWAAVVTLVAVAEELLLRGVLFNAIERVGGPVIAVAVTAVSFALLHVPLYGWGVLPLDLAVGIWLGGLRVAGGGVTAPAVAHVVADLAAWWVV